MAGKDGDSMARLAGVIVTANVASLEAAAEHLLLLRLGSSSKPFYPENPRVSVLLRIAQFRLTTASADATRVRDVAAALLRESQDLLEERGAAHLKTLSQMVLLATVNIGSYLDGWVGLLVDFARKMTGAGALAGLFGEAGGSPAMDPGSVLGGLFSIGSAKLESMEQLQLVIRQLDGVEAETRSLLLTPIEDESTDYSVLINGPWARNEVPADFDAGDAVMRYQEMADITRDWVFRRLRCSVPWHKRSCWRSFRMTPLARWRFCRRPSGRWDLIRLCAGHWRKFTFTATPSKKPWRFFGRFPQRSRAITP